MHSTNALRLRSSTRVDAESDYVKIGRSIRKLFEEYVERYNEATGSKARKDVTKK
ncbi:hypothetical protein [Cupriavidus sp. YAF13]|uniref:hypothetical protein n=1 Tax=Cupriavidus sp. YAF13 TaxID=3233075 RepID=UPI003F92B080